MISTPSRPWLKLDSALWWLLLAFGVGVGVFFRVSGLGSLAFYLDEHLHTHQAILLLNGGELTYTRSFLPVTLPVALSFKLFGISWFKARLPMVVINLLAALPLYFITKRFGKPAAFLSLFLYFTNPFIIASARGVREYAVLPLFFYTAILLAFTIPNGGRRKAALWASLALAVYLLAFDTRGFAVLSLIPLILLAGLQALAWLRQNGRAWHWALLVLLSIAAIIGIVLRVYASQKAADINNGPLQFSFQNIFLEAITTSVWQHGYWLPALGWLLLILVLGMIFGGWFNKFGMASQGVLLLGGTYILVFLFLSFLMGADGFVMRPRYGVLLETLSIPVWGVALPWLTNQAASRLPRSVPTGIIAGVAFVALFTNPQALNLIYTFHGGIPFPITGNLHYRNAEAYEYIAQRIKPGDVAMMDRFYYNDEMYGYRWGDFQWVKANDYLTDPSKEVGEQMPPLQEGWLVLYPEAMVDRYHIPLNSFDSANVHYKWHGKFGDTLIWYWTRR